jgi:hypothetical protein
MFSNTAYQFIPLLGTEFSHRRQYTKIPMCFQRRRTMWRQFKAEKNVKPVKHKHSPLSMRKGGIFGTPQAAFIVVSLLFLGCDLLNNKPEIDLETAMDAEVAWANAERLTVTVEYSSDWGYSPQRGTGKAGDTRLGFAFTVEFTPAAEYGFERWIAVRNGDYNTANPGATDISKDLNGNGVHIAESRNDTGAYIASVTISIAEGITLIPLCTDRPRIRESNPPLTTSPNPFPYDQKISLWFNMPISTVQLGQEGSIRISAVRTSGINDVGDISSYFAASLEEDNTRLDLTVIDDISRPATDLGQLVITVTAGPGIVSRRRDGGAGLPMVSAQALTYITGSEAGQKVYEAGNVQAARAAGGPYFQNSGTDWRDYGIDRRFNKTDKKTAYIKFTAQNPAGELRPPNRFTVVERLYLDLGGFPLSGSSEKQYALGNSELNQSGSSYTITHELQTASSGIIQLIILPWLDDASGYDAADPLNALVTTPPQYVTVVLDSAAPGLNNPGASLSGYASEAGGLYTYGENSSLTLTVGRMGYLSDNAAEGGIGDGEATGKPWTKDRLADLKWRAVFESGSNSKRHESAWQGAAGNTYTVATGTLFNGSTLDTETPYELKLQFADRMGNVSGLQGTGLRVEYSNQAAMIANFGDLAAFRNMVNSSGIPSGKEYILTADITLTEAWIPIGTNANAFRGTFYGNGHTITVGSGFSNAAHTGIFGYTGGSAVIRDLAVAYSSNVTVGSSATNIGGIVGYAGGTTAIRNCVVSAAGGVTLQKNGTSAALGGMAGYMEPGAVIVNSSSSLNVRLDSSTGEAWAGGAVGRIAAGGNGLVANIEGVSVSGNVSLVKTGNARMHVGGVVGASENSGWIKNVSFSGIVGASTSSAVQSANALGGIAGSASGTSFDGCVFTGTIRTPVNGGVFVAAGGTDNETRIGGIVGYYTTGGVSNPRMQNSTASGTFDITHNGSGTLSLGGVVGLANNKTDTVVEAGNKIEIKNCRYEHGNIILERNKLEHNRYDQIGGFAGKIDPCDINNCGSLAGRIRVTGRSSNYAGSLWAGGFVSEIRTGSSVTNCYSASPVEAYNYSTAGRTDHRGMAVGGFVALVQFGGIINNCYASGDLSAYAAGDRLAAGGFAGRADRFDQTAGNIIRSCYAAGDVHATSDRFTASTDLTWIDFAAGGFAGISIGTEISDCYALGDVLVEGGSAAIPVYAGGLSGYLADASNPGFTPLTNPGSIETSFAVGSVRAQSAEAAKVYAGGIVGYAASGALQKNVARGALIQAKSDDATNRKAGRVYGEKSSTPPVINSNYGLKTMTTGTCGYYDTVSPSIPSSDIGLADMHGADVVNNTSSGGIRTSSFWITTLGFNIVSWNFSDVGYRGYPYLSWQ